MHELLDELIARPDLAQRNYASRFYLKTDWCRMGMAAPVPLQADPANKMVTRAESKEDAGGPCEFDKANQKLRLCPIAFSSLVQCSKQESSHHSFTGEAATGVWAITKYQQHSFGCEFTWMTDCNGGQPSTFL